MGQSLEGKINMALTPTLIEKRAKIPSKKKGRGDRTKSPRKSAIKQAGFFQTISDQFNQVAPLDWVPTPYQVQIKAAKPVRLTPLRKKKPKGPLH